MCSYLVRIAIYVFFIALPQLNSLQYRLIFLVLAIISYLISYLQTFYSLYEDVLRKMFNISGEQTYKISVKQFDYVVSNLFPVHIELYYLVVKTSLTTAFLYISLSTFLLLGDITAREDWEMKSILSFVFLLISPAIVGFCFTNSPEKKVASQSEQIGQFMNLWNENEGFQNDRAIKKHIICQSTITKQGCNMGTVCSRLSRCLCIIILNFLCGCFMTVDKDGDCNLCSVYCKKDLDENCDDGNVRDSNTDATNSSSNSGLTDLADTNQSQDIELHKYVMRFHVDKESPNRVGPSETQE